jgi:hypothetical protein
MSPRFLSQKMLAKEPLKKMPSTAAKATSREPKVEDLSLIQRRAQSAFLRMQGTFWSGGQPRHRRKGQEAYCCQWR